MAFGSRLKEKCSLNREILNSGAICNIFHGWLKFYLEFGSSFSVLPNKWYMMLIKLKANSKI